MSGNVLVGKEPAFLDLAIKGCVAFLSHPLGSFYGGMRPYLLEKAFLRLYFHLNPFQIQEAFQRTAPASHSGD
jgi:hypothetical protein